MGLKGQKLGEWPELSIPIAREKALELAEGGLKAESVRNVVAQYEADLRAKVERNKLGINSYNTYCCRTAVITKSFGDREVFGSVTYNRLVEILDEWIATKTNNHAIELFAELRRV